MCVHIYEAKILLNFFSLAIKLSLSKTRVCAYNICYVCVCLSLYYV